MQSVVVSAGKFQSVLNTTLRPSQTESFGKFIVVEMHEFRRARLSTHTETEREREIGPQF